MLRIILISLLWFFTTGASGTNWSGSSGASGMNTGNAPATGSTNRSNYMWIKPDTLSGTFVEVSSYGTNSTGERWSFKLRQSSSNLLRIEIQGSGYSSSLVPSTGSWQFVGATLNGTTLGDHELYLDGSTESASGSNSVNTGSTQNLHIGTSGFFTGSEYDGVMGPYYFFATNISSVEREEIRWKLEGVPGATNLYTMMGSTPVTDISGNANTATLDGGNSTSLDGPPLIQGGLPL